MARYRNALPQLEDKPFVTDGGLETTLIFHDGMELPHFASIVLLRDEAGRERLRQYFRLYMDLAVKHGTGFVFESQTWRASADWGTKLGLSARELARLNREAIGLLAELRDEATDIPGAKVVSGCLGPRGDGYSPANRMSVEQAERYHRQQVDILCDTDADMVSAFTMNYTEEAIGITRAAQKAGIPVAISFTVETDGRLPTGEPLAAAIASVEAATGRGPAYYGINCAHPTHFMHALPEGAAWLERIRAVRANSSRRSHAELDEATALDEGDPADLGRHHHTLRERLAHLTVYGGCCGTDHRHVAAICEALL